MTERERAKAEGWGWIMASSSIIAAWGLLASFGRDVNAGVALGALALGIWKVVDNRDRV